MVGMSMTYTLFEWAKENLETLLEAQPESLIVEAMESVQVITKSHTLVINIVTVVYCILCLIMVKVAYFQTIGRQLNFIYFENHQVKETSEEPEAKVKVSFFISGDRVFLYLPNSPT